MGSEVRQVLLEVSRRFFALPNDLIALQSSNLLVPVRICSMSSTGKKW